MCAEIPYHCPARFTGYLADFSLNIVLQFLHPIKILGINSVFQIPEEEKIQCFKPGECDVHDFQFCVKDMVMKMCRLTTHALL